MDIESIKKLTLGPNDILFVEVDVGAMPVQHANHFMQSTIDTIKTTFGPEVKAMVVPMHRMKVSAINVQDVVFRETTRNTTPE